MRERESGEKEYSCPLHAVNKTICLVSLCSGNTIGMRPYVSAATPCSDCEKNSLVLGEYEFPSIAMNLTELKILYAM